MDDRANLISSGEHLFAVGKLKELGVGDDYTVEQYLAAVELGRELGAGEAYANKALGEPEDDVVEVLVDGRVVRNGQVSS
jgi:hypothetical protein